MKFTVFTPTYNRKSLLPRLFNYLVGENYSDLEWVIIDDGSNDGTAEYISSIQAESSFSIKYYYQNNSGKYIAFNKAIQLADGEYFVCIDSDDIYIEGAFKKLESYMSKTSDEIAGLCYLAGQLNNNTLLIGTPFPSEIEECNLIDIYGKYGVKGDKGILHRTKILKQYCFPSIPGEKFVTESVLYAQISLKYKYKLINEIIELVEYQKDGLSNTYKMLLINNPAGSLVNYSLIDKFDLRGIFLLKNTVRLLSFIFFLRESWIKYLNESSHKVLFVLCSPAGFAISIIYRLEKFLWKKRI